MTILRTVPAQWPFAEITIEQQTHYALVIEWQRIADHRGLISWHARVIYWDGEARDALVPAVRVRRVGR